MATLLSIVLVASSSNHGPTLVYAYPPSPSPLARTSRPIYRVSVDTDHSHDLDHKSDSDLDSDSDSSSSSSSLSSPTSISPKRTHKNSRERRANAERWGARYIRGEADDVDSEEELEMQNTSTADSALFPSIIPPSPDTIRKPRMLSKFSTADTPRRSSSLHSLRPSSSQHYRRRSPSAFSHYLADFDDIALANILTPSPELSGSRFELAIDSFAFIGHPVWLRPASSTPPESDDDVDENQNGYDQTAVAEEQARGRSTIRRTPQNHDVQSSSTTMNPARIASTTRSNITVSGAPIRSKGSGDGICPTNLHNKTTNPSRSRSRVKEYIDQTKVIKEPDQLPSLESLASESLTKSLDLSSSLMQSQRTHSPKVVNRKESSHDDVKKSLTPSTSWKRTPTTSSSSAGGRTTSLPPPQLRRPQGASNSHEKSKESDMLKAFNLVLVIDIPPDQHLSRHLDVYYRDVVIKVTAAIKHEEINSGWLSREVFKIIQDRESAIDSGIDYNDYVENLAMSSSLCSNLKILFDSLKTSNTASVTFNYNLDLSILLRWENFRLASLGEENRKSHKQGHHHMNNHDERTSFSLEALSKEESDMILLPWMTLLPLEDISNIMEEARNVWNSEHGDKILIKFLEIWNPRKTFKELQKAMKVSLNSFKEVVGRLIRWRKGRIVGVIGVKNIYTPTLRFDPHSDRVSSSVHSFNYRFPDLPPLPTLLSKLSQPQPLSNLINNVVSISSSSTISPLIPGFSPSLMSAPRSGSGDTGGPGGVGVGTLNSGFGGLSSIPMSIPISKSTRSSSSRKSSTSPRPTTTGTVAAATTPTVISPSSATTLTNNQFRNFPTNTNGINNSGSGSGSGIGNSSNSPLSPIPDGNIANFENVGINSATTATTTTTSASASSMSAIRERYTDAIMWLLRYEIIEQRNITFMISLEIYQQEQQEQSSSSSSSSDKNAGSTTTTATTTAAAASTKKQIIISNPHNPSPNIAKHLRIIHKDKSPSAINRFNKIQPYLNGKNSVDEILYKAHLSRRDLRQTLSEYSPHLISFLV